MSAAISNPTSFREEAQFQRECALCQTVGGSFHAHHVVGKNRLKKMGLVHRLYDPRNAVRLCEGLGTDKCHHKVEQGGGVLATERLPDAAICFIWETLNVAGQNHLEREYTGIERRYTLHQEGRCLLCQK